MIQPILFLLLVFTVVWFVYVGFSAHSLVGQRWLPALAFLSIVGAPFSLGYLFYGFVFRQVDHLDDPQVVHSAAGASIEFIRYAILALMLHLIARRLPEGSRRGKGEAKVEGGD